MKRELNIHNLHTFAINFSIMLFALGVADIAFNKRHIVLALIMIVAGIIIAVATIFTRAKS